MRSWIKKHIGLSIGIGILLILLLVCSGTVFVWSNYSKINRTLWERTKPEKYLLETNYYLGSGCSRSWESVWEGNKLVNITSNEISADDFCPKEVLDVDGWSIDYVFDVAVGNCGKGTVYCQVEYDPHFHYPSKVTSAYQYIFVANVVVCDKDKSSCP
jgi:hypothetical protein